MHSDFDSEQIILTGQEFNPGDAHEVVFTIGLKCTARSFGGSFGPSGGDPPYDAEFELVSIHIPVPHVKTRSPGPDNNYYFLELTYQQFIALVGVDTADEMIEQSISEAIDSGEF